MRERPQLPDAPQPDVFGNEYLNQLFNPRSKALAQHRLMIGVPMTGIVRSEWAMSRYGQIIPCNWAHQDMHQWLSQSSPLGFAVAEARNIIIDTFMRGNWTWLLFIDHDVLMPADAFVRFNQYMMDAKVPVVCGIYFAKCHPPEPLIYRGRGNGHYKNWQPGDKVWVDGIPFGLTLIHRSLIEVMYEDAPSYRVQDRIVKKVIDTPSGVYHDPQTGMQGFSGTEDLAWCNRVIAGNYLKKAGWPKIAEKKYPFLCDTGIFAKHITMDGKMYPLPGYESYPAVKHAKRA